MMVADLDPASLQGYVVDGSIDTDLLDSGKQVLVYAPTVCMKRDGDGYQVETGLYPGEIRDGDWETVIRNDAFTAGMPLKLLELVGNNEGGTPDPWYAAYTEWTDYYGSLEAIRPEVTAGAVLSGPAVLNNCYLSSFTVIVSPKGAKAMGLKLHATEYANVFVDSGLTAAEEAETENRVAQIAGENWMESINRLKEDREYRARKLRQILLFAALILLFFAVSVFMQVSGAARRIRSETRTIGTLRAAGADLKTLVGCYRLPVWTCAAAALVPCLLVYLLSPVPALRIFSRYHPLIVIPVLAAMAAVVALACIAGIRNRLAAVSRQSIVENIREL